MSRNFKVTPNDYLLFVPMLRSTPRVLTKIWRMVIFLLLSLFPRH